MLAGPSEQTQVELLARTDLYFVLCPISYRSHMSPPCAFERMYGQGALRKKMLANTS